VGDEEYAEESGEGGGTESWSARDSEAKEQRVRRRWPRLNRQWTPSKGKTRPLFGRFYFLRCLSYIHSMALIEGEPNTHTHTNRGLHAVV